MHTVVVVALPDVIAFDLATAVETFGRAVLPDGRSAYRVVVAGSGREVDAGPMRITPGEGLDALARADTIVVPGRNRPDAPVAPEVRDGLRSAASEGSRIASICVGAFVLADAGLLDGKRATTHWLATDLLAHSYPGVRVDPDALYVDEGQVLTSAGASAGIDLCLHMIRRDHGTAVASHAARLAVAPLNRSGGQAQFILRNLPTYQTDSLEHVLSWIEDNAHLPLTLADIAEAAHSSVRTVSRRFRRETGQSPVEWLIGVRIRHAQELLETTDRRVEHIARHVGFTNPGNFRTQFRRTVGVTPSDYRATFAGGAIDQA